MNDSRIIKIAPDSEYNKRMLYEHESYYKEFGVDFHSTYQCADRRNEWKEPTTSREVFGGIMGKIPIDKNWVFLDCGCGLGHAMYLATFYFNRVYGVEYLDEVADIARQNLMKLLPGNDSCKIFSCDMFELDEAVVNETNVFYISSPFLDVELFDKWINVILRSRREAEREIWIVYYYPYCERVMEKYRDVFPLVDTFTADASEAISRVNYYRSKTLCKTSDVNKRCSDVI